MLSPGSNPSAEHLPSSAALPFLAGGRRGRSVPARCTKTAPVLLPLLQPAGKAPAGGSTALRVCRVLLWASAPSPHGLEQGFFFSKSL